MLKNDLKTSDPEIHALMQDEIKRQSFGLELIASENFVSEAVMEAVGSVMTNKYAEGYPYYRFKEAPEERNYSRNGRYYGGCEVVDKAERLAIDRAIEICGAEHANVQPHSGSQANMAVYHAVVDPGDTVMGMDLSHGGHLTHGSPVNFSGIFYNIVPYGVSEGAETIDYDKVREIAKKCNPKMIVVGASAYPRIIDFKAFRDIADETGAKIMVDMAHIAGLVATGHHPNPVPYADFVTTTTHKTLRGPRGGMILCKNEYAKEIDMKVFPGIQGGPLMHVIAGKAVAFKEAMSPGFKEYQGQVVKNAAALAEALISKGYRLVSGGTDNHLMLVNVLASAGISGKKAQSLLGEAEITVNKNTIPFDTKSPFVTSGIRLGTPALTSRGMKEPEMREIAALIDNVLRSEGDADILSAARSGVRDLCGRYPLYQYKLEV